MAEFDFDADSCQSTTSKRSVRSYSSKSSTTFRFSLSQDQSQQQNSVHAPNKSSIKSGDDDDDNEASSRRQQLQQDEINLPGRHVRFSLSESQGSSSIDSSLNREMAVESSSVVVAGPSVASVASSSSLTSGSGSRASCLRKNTYGVNSRLSSQQSSNLSSSVETNSNGSSSKNNSVVGSKSRGMSSMILKRPQRGRRRLHYSSGMKSTASDNMPRAWEPDNLEDVKQPSALLNQVMRPPTMDRLKPTVFPEEESVDAKPVRGAGANVFAIQDAGTQQMLTDDCGYLCSTILSSSLLVSGDTSRAAATTTISTTTPRRAIKALEIASCDLALLVSNSKTRCALWVDGRTSKAGPMLNILNVLGVIHSSQLACPPKVSRLVTTTRNQHEEVAGTMDEDVHSQESLTSIDREGRQGVATESCIIPESVKSSMASLLHFLSWDCTMSELSASQYKFGRRSTRNVASMAQRIRRHMLEHPNAMKAVGRLIVDDPLTRQIMCPNRNSMEDSDVGDLLVVEPTSQESIMSDISGGATQDFAHPVDMPTESNDPNPSDAASDNSTPTKALINSGDPTAAGRRRRKRKRMLDAAGLEPIAEEKEDEMGHTSTSEQASVMSPPRKRVYGSATAQESSPNGKLSFTSHESPLRSPNRGRDDNDEDEESKASMIEVQIREKLMKVQSKLFLQVNERGKSCQYCRRDEFVLGESPSYIALQAVNRIIAGKEGEEESCLDQAMNDASESQSSMEDNEDETNPLLVTNRLLGESGLLPYLAQCLAETVQAASCLIHNSSSVRSLCLSCLAGLHERVSVLANLIDGACCLNAANRRICCDHDLQGLLIGSLVIFFHSAANLRESDQWPNLDEEGKLIVCDILLIATRVLTSLTHENEIAAQQLLVCHRFLLPSNDTVFESGITGTEVAIVGLDVLLQLCYLAVQWRARQATDKHAYDVIIFCLNTLSNTMDFCNVRDSLLEANVPETGLMMPDSNLQSVYFFTWLARWLVSETEAFRDTIMQGTFGAPVAKSVESRDLHKDEEESLVVAGHGMVVLACAMTSARTDANGHRLARAVELVTKEMPPTENTTSSRLLLVKNTLKAFCNFYRFSIGELSVAVVEPVRDLLAKLEEVGKVH